jgi:hypothetical protein
MTTTTSRLLTAPLGLLAAALLAAGCAGQSSTGGTSADSALGAAVASATDSSGTLLCTPSQGQIDACSGMAAGAACTLTLTNPLPDGTTSVAGTCRTTLDGTVVACAPNPPAPPAWLVEACSGKAAGDACTATEPDGDTRDGTCVTARDGSTLICGRAYAPPQAAIDACATLAAGDTCMLPEGGDGGHDVVACDTTSGVCALGPGGTGPLACTEARHLRPSATAACAGLAAGAACTLGHEDKMNGSCVVPAAGGDAVCVPACSALGGRFSCRDGGGGHGDMPGFPMPGPGMPGPGGHH